MTWTPVHSTTEVNDESPLNLGKFALVWPIPNASLCQYGESDLPDAWICAEAGCSVRRDDDCRVGDFTSSDFLRSTISAI